MPRAAGHPAALVCASVKSWQSAEFITAMRTGLTPDGRTLSDGMPWESFGKMDDQSLTAVYEYLKGL